MTTSLAPHPLPSRFVALALCLLALPAPAAAPPDAGAGATGDAGAGAAIDGNATPMLDPARIARLPAAERAAWTAYVEASRQLSARDHASMDAELRAAGKPRMTRAPYRKAFRIEAEMTPAYFATPEARRAAEAMMSFQTPSGGWSKRTEIMARPRQPGESYYSESDGWSYIATLDNDATTSELRFLAGVDAAAASAPGPAAMTTPPALREAFARGLDYLLAAQMPNGCWPQVFPLAGGYHDAATFNDDAIVNVLRLLGDVAAGNVPAAPAAARPRAAQALARGISCVVACQVVVGGVRTVWAQQHDPLTLAPVAARSYELVGLAGRESSNVATYLLSLSSPDDRTVEAVHAAATWFRQHQISGLAYDAYELRKAPGAGPLWARLYEIPTFRPFFSNRDGIKLYDWEGLTDRRKGYTWYNKEPAAMLAAYDAWAPAHPAPARKPAARKPAARQKAR